MATMFEYAVFVNEKRDKEGELVEEAEVVVPVTAIAARDEAQAQLIASRAIPDELISGGKMERLMVVVRPF